MTASGDPAQLASRGTAGIAAATLGPAFCAATVFAVAADRPGVVAPAGGPVPVFSSLEQLGRYAGPVRWLSTTGEDLLRLLPPGTDLLLDPAGDRPLLLSGSQVDRRLILAAHAQP